MCPGGYQMVNMNGAGIASDAVIVITDAKIADILRRTNKPVYFHNVTLDGNPTNIVAVIRTNTGAADGRVYGFIGPDGIFFNVTTDDNKITFTPN